MNSSLPLRLAISFLALFSLIFAGCSSEPKDEKADLSTALDQAVQVIATNAASESGGPEAVPVVAEIMEIVDGGSSGTWAVAVRFANGITDPCIIEVTDTRTGRLLIRDEVASSDDENFIHETQFQFRGRANNLAVRVSETGSGTTLATAP